MQSPTLLHIRLRRQESSGSSIQDYGDTFMKGLNVLSPSYGTVLRDCNKALTNLGCNVNKQFK
jgi:hypothetical protein